MKKLPQVLCNGVLQFSINEERTRLKLASDGEFKTALVVCCDCGLVHEFVVDGDELIAVRAPASVANAVRQKALAEQPDLFPVRLAALQHDPRVVKED